MKRTIVALLIAAVAFAGTVSLASADNGPAVIKMPAKMGEVTFKHAEHQKRLNGDCKACHTAAPGKIEGFGKDWAHKTCKDCHKEKNGPTKCTDCHKK